MGRMAADIVGYGEKSGWTEQLQRKKWIKKNPISNILINPVLFFIVKNYPC